MAGRAKVKGRGAGIPEDVFGDLERRLVINSTKWCKCKGVDVQQRGAFAYVQVQTEKDGEFEPFCRLRYLGNEQLWEFAFYSFAGNRYEPSFLPSGVPFGTPEECFDCSALGYLR